MGLDQRDRKQTDACVLATVSEQVSLDSHRVLFKATIRKLTGMKIITTLLLVLLNLVLLGCATASFTQGVEFDTSKVSLIVKGETTKSEVLDWFGQPLSKGVSGADGETWIYMFSEGTSKAQSYATAH